MKLVRYGAKGQEKPGLIDKSGQLRDLSAHVKDLDGEAYSPASLAKLAALDASWNSTAGNSMAARRIAAPRRVGKGALAPCPPSINGAVAIMVGTARRRAFAHPTAPRI